MRLVIIDDDKVVRENLKTLLVIYASEHEVIGEADGVQSGLKCLKKLKPDLLLLDIEMKDGSGFDLLAFYGDLDFKVIFVTGHNGHAIKAFKFSALDYVLKPVDPDDLITAIKKADDITYKQDQGLKVANLVNNKKTPNNDQKIVLKNAESVYLVAIKDIIRCESDTNYTRFFLKDSRVILVSKTLKEYALLFEDQSFFRAHQSHLINLSYFDKFEKKDGGTVFMKDGSTLPVAVRKKEALLSALNKL